MKIIVLAVLFALCGCGTYAGLDGVHYFQDGLPPEVTEQGIEIVSPEVAKASLSGLTGLLGPYASLAGLVPGALALLASFFVTKRKKGK